MRSTGKAGCEALARPEREGPDVSTPCDPATKVRPARPLSGREVDILHWITQGDSNKQIARRFDIRDTTVKVHVKAILRKIGARNRTEAATWVLRHGLPDPAPVREPNGGLPASHVLTGEEVDELPMRTIDRITALQSVREYRTPDADGTSRRVIEFEGGARFEVIYDDGEPVDYRAERVRFESRAGSIVVSGAALSCATAVEAQGQRSMGGPV